MSVGLDESPLVVPREVGRRVWKQFGAIVSVGFALILLIFAWVYGVGIVPYAFVHLWQGFLVVAVFGAVGITVVDLTFEPTEVVLTNTGLTFFPPTQKHVWKWQDLYGVDPLWYGVVLRRKAVPQRNLFMRRLVGEAAKPRPGRGMLLTPNQLRAVLTHPSCPRWTLTDSVRKKAGLAS